VSITAFPLSIVSTPTGAFDERSHSMTRRVEGTSIVRMRRALSSGASATEPTLTRGCDEQRGRRDLDQQAGNRPPPLQRP